jgi:hypothetical protein
MNVAARSIADISRSDIITDTLASLYWLRAPQRFQFKLAVLTFRSLHDQALTTCWWPASATSLRNTVPSTQQSASTSQLDVRPTQLKTLGDRALAVAGASLWNDLHDDMTNCQSLPTFRRKLKTFLFGQSYPDILIWFAIKLERTKSIHKSLKQPSSRALARFYSKSFR